jgi:hypothetical protein
MDSTDGFESSFGTKHLNSLGVKTMSIKYVVDAYFLRHFSIFTIFVLTFTTEDFASYFLSSFYFF